MAIAKIGTMSATRSVSGSTNLPNSLMTSNLRAHQPSTQSVAPMAPHSQAAAHKSSCANRSHRNTGTQARRASEIMFGTVRILSSKIPS